MHSSEGTVAQTWAGEGDVREEQKSGLRWKKNGTAMHRVASLGHQRWTVGEGYSKFSVSRTSIPQGLSSVSTKDQLTAAGGQPTVVGG